MSFDVDTKKMFLVHLHYSLISLRSELGNESRKCKVNECVRDDFFYDELADIRFVIHWNFNKREEEVCLYMMNNQGEPSRLDKLIETITDILECEPVEEKDDFYLGPCELVFGHKAKLLLWKPKP
jgi:hypothetical protein